MVRGVGLPTFEGRPHFYVCIFDDGKDDYTNLFRLTPIDPEIFQLAMEDWQIWKRWEKAFHSGEVKLDTHPCLPHDRKRHEAIKAIVEPKLVSDPKAAITRLGEFRANKTEPLPKGVLRSLQITWKQP
jgi:hypothetical protein